METQLLPTVMAAQIATFMLAALLHAGLLLDGYARGPAATAETVIALVQSSPGRRSTRPPQSKKATVC